MTSTRFRAAAALSILVLAAGCGGGDDKDAGSSADDFAKQDAAKIADAAKADMKALDSVRYAGEISSSGSSVNLDVQADADGDCTGTVGIGDGSAEVLAKDGKNWFRPDDAFWQQQAPDDADAIIAAVSGKWVVDNDGSFAQFCDLDAFFDSVFADDGTANEYKTLGTDELDGQAVVKVENKGEKGTATGYVLVDSPHYLLKIERTEGDDPGKIEFSEFGAELDVEAPGEDEVVDLSQL